MRCAVKRCSNHQKKGCAGYDNDIKKSFFAFPTKKTQLKKWIDFCEQTRPFKRKSWRICSDHFNDEDIFGGVKFQLGFTQRRTVKPGAVPCRYKETIIDEERAQRIQRRENKRIVEELLKQVSESAEELEPELEAEQKPVLDPPATSNNVQYEITEFSPQATTLVLPKIFLVPKIFSNTNPNIVPNTALNMVRNIVPNILAKIVPNTLPSSTTVSKIVPNTLPSSTIISKVVPNTLPSSTIISKVVPNALPSSTIISKVVPNTLPRTTMISRIVPNTLPSSTIISSIVPSRVPSSAISNTVNSALNIRNNENTTLTNVNMEEVANLKLEVVHLKKQLKAQQQINRRLETDFSQKEKRYKKEIAELKKKTMKLEFHCKNVDEKLKGIFTDGQINRIKNGDKRQVWTQADISNSVTLYSASPKAYTLLKKMNFPLPAVRTLQNWGQKLEIEPGLLQPVINILAETRHTTEKQKICVLTFDKMKIRETSDSSTAKNVQVAMLRGFISKWRQPVFYDFNCNMTTDIVKMILQATKECGYTVVAIVCKLEDANRELLTDLEVNHEKPWFVFDKQKIYVFAEVPHLMKLLRNHFLDEGFLIDEKPVEKDIIEDLYMRHKISYNHLEITGTERQKVKMATKLFSHTVAQAVNRAASLGLFDEKNWLQCFKLLKTTNDWFDVMNCREKSCAYGSALDVQNKILDNMSNMVTEMRAIGKTELLPVQIGILQTNMALKMLHLDIKARFQIDYVLTCRLNQDVIQNFFAIIRTKAGIYDYPDPQQFKRRLRAYLVGHNKGLLFKGDSMESDETSEC